MKYHLDVLDQYLHANQLNAEIARHDENVRKREELSKSHKKEKEMLVQDANQSHV